MDPGLGICEGTWSESLNECERGASYGVFLGDFQLGPDSETWKRFWSDIPDEPLACSGCALPCDLVVEQGNFCHYCGNPLCECRHLTLKVDEKCI